MKLRVEELEVSVVNVARKYSRKTTMSFEDMVQELWLCMVEKDLDNMALANTVLVNKAKDLCRQDWRRYGGINQVDFDDPMGIVFVEENRTDNGLCEDVYTGIEYDEIINKLPERERKFAVAKAYLNGGLEHFEKEFNKMYNELSNEEKNMIDSNKGNYTDDIIIKVFLKIKTGTNSGSARKLKWNLKNLLLGGLL